MIEVNLMTDRTSGVRQMFATPKVTQMGPITIAILVLATGTMGIWNCSIHGQVAAAIEKRTKLRIRDSRLHKLKTEMEHYREMKDLYKRRIHTIEQLKINQTRPVLLLNALIQSIPHDGNLWLNSLTQKSDDIKIVGFAQNIEVIPDLMSNLVATGIFDTVDLQEIIRRGEASEFSLLCRIINNTAGEKKNGRP